MSRDSAAVGPESEAMQGHTTRRRWLAPVLVVGLGGVATAISALTVALAAAGWWFTPRGSVENGGADAPEVPAEVLPVPVAEPVPAAPVPEPVPAVPGVTPAPVPARPAPVRPAPKPVPVSGVRLELTGDASAAQLVSDQLRFDVPGVVPEGSYVVRAEFPGAGWVDAGQVVVLPGGGGQLRCTAGFFRCGF